VYAIHFPSGERATACKREPGPEIPRHPTRGQSTPQPVVSPIESKRPEEPLAVGGELELVDGVGAGGLQRFWERDVLPVRCPDYLHRGPANERDALTVRRPSRFRVKSFCGRKERHGPTGARRDPDVPLIGEGDRVAIRRQSWMNRANRTRQIGGHRFLRRRLAPRHNQDECEDNGGTDRRDDTSHPGLSGGDSHTDRV
jgi:hypothetical protein